MSEGTWTLDVLDADPPADALVSLGAGDLDGDGRAEVVTGGEDGIFWYRPATYERGVVAADATTMVGLALEDVDGDGRDEVVASVRGDDGAWRIEWFDPGDCLDGGWSRSVVDADCPGGPHDVCHGDVDGDGEPELVANAAFTETPGVFVYDRPDDPGGEWDRYPVSTGLFAEGLALGDVDDDGAVEILNGPDLFHRPAEGADAREWDREVVAPSMRAFCRTALVDVTGNGRLDVVLSESEYPDSRLVWVENRGDDGWRTHELERGLYDVHTLSAWREDGEVHVYAAEMAEGGWGGHYRWGAEQLRYASDDGGASWSRDVLARGAGTHEGVAVDVDGDGVREFVGKEANHPVVHALRRQSYPSAVADLEHRLLDRDKPYASTDVLAADVDGDGRPDVVTGGWWYRAPDWERFDVPGIAQVHAAADLDGDGRVELIGTTGGSAEEEPDPAEAGAAGGPPALTSDLVWARPVDPLAGEWERGRVGEGSGDWVQGSALAPVGPDGEAAFVASYHADGAESASPEIFAVPADLSDDWTVRTVDSVPAGQDVIPVDLTDGDRPDLVVGGRLVETLADGGVETHGVLPDGFDVARLAAGDVTGDWRPNLVAGEAVGEFAGGDLPASNRAGFDAEDNRLQGPRPSLEDPPFGRLAWFDPPENPREAWSPTVIDRIRHPRSVGLADVDGDGVPEIFAGEHDPSWRYRSGGRLFAYERADADGRAWSRHLLEDRFEHNAGAEVVSLGDERPAVLSHGWSDTKYVHLVELVEES
ncbi:MAG: FG-GAP repeat domain-containing protein [Haloarculaceae archaeon]